MHKLLSSCKGLYPFVLCDGYCGIGKAIKENPDTPYFYISSFDSKHQQYFQPEQYFKMEEGLDVPLNIKTIYTEEHPSIFAFEKAIDIFQQDPSLQKVVLARKRTHTLTQPLSLQEILSTLLKNFPISSIYVFMEEEGKAFFGSTPENLYLREDNKIVVDCIAGTTDSAKDGDLFTEKNSKEHKFVTQGVVDVLKKLGSDISTSEIGIKKAAALKHIFQTVSATLYPKIKDQQIIDTLHPTAATSGFPKNSALQFLAKNEQMDRGFYAGTIGWISKKKAVIKVALRCALAEKEKLTLFAGAGIVKESSAVNEQEEIDKKFCTLEGAFFETTMSKQ